MAIDLTDKALNLASEIVNEAEKFMTALENLRNLEDERAAAGITLGDYDADYLLGSLKHIDGAALNGAINTSIPAIWTFMTANNHDDNLQKVRP